MSKSAIIIGATGLTGSWVLKQLLSNDKYDRVLLFSRTSVGMEHPKLEEHLGDVLNLEQFKDSFKADEVYCCIGTTKKKTPDQKAYREIDFGIPVSAAKMAKENGSKVFAVVSSIGADPKSKIFYSRTKGEMEEAVLSVGIERTYVLRPSIILGDRNEKRFAEKVGGFIFRLFNPLLFGKLKKYRAVKSENIAKKMIQLANSEDPSGVIEGMN